MGGESGGRVGGGGRISTAFNFLIFIDHALLLKFVFLRFPEWFFILLMYLSRWFIQFYNDLLCLLSFCVLVLVPATRPRYDFLLWCVFCVAPSYLFTSTSINGITTVAHFSLSILLLYLYSSWLTFVVSHCIPLHSRHIKKRRKLLVRIHLPLAYH